jgi:hypothetical protein
VLVHLFDIPFDVTIMYHRWLGIATFGIAILHVAFTWQKWISSDLSFGEQVIDSTVK